MGVPFLLFPLLVFLVDLVICERVFYCCEGFFQYFNAIRNGNITIGLHVFMYLSISDPGVL